MESDEEDEFDAGVRGPDRDRSRSRDFHEEETARPTQLDSDDEPLVSAPSWVTRNRFAVLRVVHADGAQGVHRRDLGAVDTVDDTGRVDEGLLDSLEHDLREPRRRRTRRRIHCDSDSDGDAHHRWRESPNDSQEEMRASIGEATTVAASTNAVRGARNETAGPSPAAHRISTETESSAEEVHTVLQFRGVQYDLC